MLCFSLFEDEEVVNISEGSGAGDFFAEGVKDGMGAIDSLCVGEGEVDGVGEILSVGACVESGVGVGVGAGELVQIDYCLSGIMRLIISL